MGRVRARGHQGHRATATEPPSWPYLLRLFPHPLLPTLSRRAFDAAQLSILVPTHHQRKYMPRTINSIFTQGPAQDVEAIVFNADSSDDTESALRQRRRRRARCRTAPARSCLPKHDTGAWQR
ncbi:MAG: glycosyltransferase [Rhodanobacter sp.]